MSEIRESIKICGVCGDKAIAKNFGAYSCESCKAFFRRNASKLNSYKCYFDEKCKLDSVTRKFCRRCRLKKCFDIGMKQEWILNDEEKEMRRKKIQEKRNNRKNSVHSLNSKSSSSPETSNTDSLDLDLFDSTISDEEIITNLMDIESYILSDENNLNDNSTESDDISDEVYRKAVELEFAIIPIARPLPENSNSFNELECNRLTELFSALNIWRKPLPQTNSQVMNVEEMCHLIPIKIEKDIRSLVEVSKRLSAFNSMCENDKISLLKYGSIEIFCMRSVLTYNFETNVWTLDLDNNQSILIKMDLYEEETDVKFSAHKKYLRKIGKEWDSDPYILDLLTAITLFNPDRPNLIHKELVKLQQQMYLYLLQRYLQLKTRSECESKEKFLRLLNCLHDLDVFNKLQLRPCAGGGKCNGKVDTMGPLLKEILDIKS